MLLFKRWVNGSSSSRWLRATWAKKKPITFTSWGVSDSLYKPLVHFKIFFWPKHLTQVIFCVLFWCVDPRFLDVYSVLAQRTADAGILRYPLKPKHHVIHLNLHLLFWFEGGLLEIPCFCEGVCYCLLLLWLCCPPRSFKNFAILARSSSTTSASIIRILTKIVLVHWKDSVEKYIGDCSNCVCCFGGCYGFRHTLWNHRARIDDWKTVFSKGFRRVSEVIFECSEILATLPYLVPIPRPDLTFSNVSVCCRRWSLRVWLKICRKPWKAMWWTT